MLWTVYCRREKSKFAIKKVIEMVENRKELVITRVFNAPRKVVWKAWTDPKILKKWWGPRGVTNPTCKWDAKPGGKINVVMLAGKELGSYAGQKWPMTGTFREVTPESRLVYIAEALDDVKDILIETENTMELEELGNKTKMKFHIVVTKAGPKAEMAMQGMEMGWNQSIEKLGEELEKD
jgi:uncharacterized protein YndB with AHSA1/START domain